MYLLQDSKDLLYITIAFCVLFLSFFLVWLTYYLTMIVRQVYIIFKEVREKFQKLNDVIKEFKEKFDHSASYLALINEGIKKITKVVKNHSGKVGKKAVKKKKK